MNTFIFSHKSTVMKIAGITLIAGLLLGLATAILPTTTLAQGDPWTCDGTIYVTTGNGRGRTTLSSVDTTTNPWSLTTLLRFRLNLNALAYNPVDNFMYGTNPNNGRVYRIGQSDAQYLGTPTGGWPGGSNWYAATFVYNPGPPASNPVYVVVRDSYPYPIVRLDVSTTPPTILSQGTLDGTYYDIAFNPIDGQMYGVREDGDNWSPDHTFTINPNSFDENELGSVGHNGTWAAAFADVNGRVFFYDISDGFYQANLTSGALTWISDAATVSRGDGASCAQAELPVPKYDYGDAPDTDGQTTALHGARHIIVPDAPYLGATPPDDEADGQPTTAADGDDNTGDDDEDGLVGVGPNWSSGSGAIEVHVSNVTSSACVYAWVDWDDDGFGVGSDSTSHIEVTADGTTTMTFTNNLPTSGNFPASAYLRLRVVEDACGSLAPTGDADNGEVEDHVLHFDPTAVTLQSINATATASANWLVAALLAGFATLVGVYVLRKRSL